MSHPALANAELSVMKLLWKTDGMTARGLREELYPESTKAQHGTVQRLLQRLEDKGFVQRNKDQSTHIFKARIKNQDYACNQLEALTDKLAGGSLAPLITHMVEENRISKSDIERLKKILEDFGS